MSYSSHVECTIRARMNATCHDKRRVTSKGTHAAQIYAKVITKSFIVMNSRLNTFV